MAKKTSTHSSALETAVNRGIALLSKATPGKWFIRNAPRGDGFFIQAPRLNPTDPYDIEILGEDDTLYPTRRADAEAIVGLVEMMRAYGPQLAAAARLLATQTSPLPSTTIELAHVAASNLRHGRWEDQAAAIEAVIAALPTVEMVPVQEAWEAAGGNPGIKATRIDLLEALKAMDEADDEAQAEAESWHRPGVEPECLLENEWGFYARVLVECADGTRRKAVYDPATQQFQVPFDGEEIGGVVAWRADADATVVQSAPSLPKRPSA